ncbi:hypothetical protein [Candidatus Nitrosocosmicus oleophilus]|nr:hypothetical protein [Candidatus Nitrosocosmicus oleophilus]
MSINSQTSHAAPTNSSNLIYSKDSHPYGTSYSEWMSKWWQWHVSLPNKVNEQDPSNLSQIHPRESYSPEKCAWNQTNKDVWFLSDGRSLGLSDFADAEIRKCTVPQDKALLVQIYGGGCDFSEGLKTDEELRDCVNIGLDTVKFTAKVDGVEVMSSENRADFLHNPFLYNITYTDDNIYDVSPGTYRAMANGYFLFLKPLDIGNHMIEFNEAYFKPGSEGQPSPENRLSNVVYDVTVK